MATHLDIQSRSMVLGGRAFGKTGAYEKIAGSIHFSIDPLHPANQAITDITLAPRDAQGRVCFKGDFYLLKPLDMTKGNGHLLMDVPNRGRKVAIEIFNSTPRVADLVSEQDFGNEFLMREGYTVAWIGWQVDVPRRDGLMGLDVPRVPGLKGWIRCRLRPNDKADVLALADRLHIPNAVTDLKDEEAWISARTSGGAEPIRLARSSWHFVDEGHIKLEGGFLPGVIYDVVYRSQNPLVVGLGLLALREAGAFFKWQTQGNPCAGGIVRSTLFGVSQSGRLIRQMIYLGLDQDESQRVVFDALMPHVAGARQGEFNLRWGQPSLNSHATVGGVPPAHDKALYARFSLRAHPPKIFAINTAAEYWRGDASLIHTDETQTQDAEPPSFVRTYFLAGTQHTPGPIPPPPTDANTGARGLHLFNVVDYSPLLRAALVNLDQWIGQGVEPPPSAFPRLSDATAVAAETLREVFVKFPAVRFPDRLVHMRRLDFGPQLALGIAQYPAREGALLKSYVSAVDTDGNEISGIRPVEISVPLATFTGWNLRHPEQGAGGDLMQMRGSTLPFAKTKEERMQCADPRLSMAERYTNREAYLESVREAFKGLVALRHVLSQDEETIVSRAQLRWDFLHSL